MIKNRNGEESTFLATEVVKILVAVICVAFLTYLITQVWYGANKSPNLKKAEASLELISNEILRINEGGEANPTGILISNPAGWDILSFSENEKPNLCAGEKCICICDVYSFDNLKSQTKKCDKTGVCKIVKNLAFFNRIKIKNSGIFLSIQKNEEGVIINELK